MIAVTDSELCVLPSLYTDISDVESLDTKGPVKFGCRAVVIDVSLAGGFSERQALNYQPQIANVDCICHGKSMNSDYNCQVRTAANILMSAIEIMTRCIKNPVILLLWFSLVATGCGLAIDNEGKIARAQEAMQTGEYRAAIIDSKAVLLDEPDNGVARLLLGRASVRAGDAASAEIELRRAIDLGVDLGEVAVDLGAALLGNQKYEVLIEEITPELAAGDADRREIYMLRGRALLALERTEDARASFGDVLALDASDVDAQLGIVSAYGQDGNYPQARATLDFVTESNGESIAAWLASGELALQTNEIDRAVSDFKRAQALAKSQESQLAEVAALNGLGNAMLAQSDFDSARDVLTQLVLLVPDAPSTKELSARIAFVDEDWALAQENLQGILRQFPDYRPAQMMLGAVHLESGNLAQAEMYLSAVVAAAPSNADARRYLAETRYRLDKSDAARETLRPLLDDDSVADVRSLEMAARASLNAGDFEYAAQYLRKAVEADPNNPDSQLGLVTAYLMADRMDDAQAILDSVDVSGDDLSRLRRDILITMSMLQRGENAAALEDARRINSEWPDNPVVLNLVGALELSSANFAAARANFETSATIAPENLMSLRYLAAVDEAEEKFNAARNRYLEIIAKRANDTSAMLAMARLSANDEDYRTAQSWLEKAIEADSEQSLNPRLYLGRMLLATRDFAGAKLAAEETIEVFSSNASAHGLLGYARLNLDDAPGAVQSFETAIKLDSGESEYRLALARAQTALGKPDEATATMERAYESGPGSVPVAVFRATQLMDEGNFAEAIEIARKLQIAHPDSPVALALESEVLSRDGRLVEAAEKYDDVLEIENSSRYAVRAYQLRESAGMQNKMDPLINHLDERPLNTDVRIFLAQAYQVDGNDNGAAQEYEKALKIVPDNHVAANNLAWIYFTQNDPRAEAAARNALSLAPENDSIMDTLGWILVKTGKASEGVNLLRKAAAKSSGRAEIRYHLAAGLVESGQEDEARNILGDIINSKDQFPSRNAAEQLLRAL